MIASWLSRERQTRAGSALKNRFVRPAISVATVAAAIFVLQVVLVKPQAALACTSGTNSSNSHVQGGIDHGWNRVWSCDQWVYHGWTDHSHGDKFADLANFSTNTTKCSDFETGATEAFCSFSSTSTSIGSDHDTGNTGGCDLFSDGHGICLHSMEPLP
jgi:hypothetical protein